MKQSNDKGGELAPEPRGYPTLLGELKQRISSARVKAALAVNAQLIALYWSLGKDILDRQEREGWGSRVLERLSADLRGAFPDMTGLSARNLAYMRDLAREWPDEAIVPQLVAQVPWGHNRMLMHKVKDRVQREWYLRACVQHGWSRNVFEMQIKSGLYARRRGALSNFDRTLPAAQSDLARELLKDPFNFEFLGLAEDAREREVERGLVAHMRDFLIELGQGFAFLGSQVPIEVGGQSFHLDLLFYHVKLRCHVVIELKTRAFQPEFAGKLNFYLSTVDELLRHPADGPSIGLLLCRSRNGVVVEYSLRNMSTPLGVAEYGWTADLPEELKGALPSVEELEKGMRG